MALGDEIRDVLKTVGTKLSVYAGGSGESLATEYIDYDVNIRTSNPFHREFFLETTFPYDSKASAGDVITFAATGQSFVVMTKTPVIFENVVIENDNVVYRCNVSGELLRPSQQIDPDAPNSENYVNVFASVRNPCYGLLTESNYDNDWDVQKEFGDYARRKMFLYVPNAIGIETEDRYMPISGEYYKVGIVRRRVFPETDIAMLSEDTR